MNWLILIIAGLCETAFAFCLGKTKLVDGTEFWAWIAGFAFFYVLSAVLLAKATQTIPIGIAYPVWTGIGAVGAVIFDRNLFIIEIIYIFAEINYILYEKDEYSPRRDFDGALAGSVPHPVFPHGPCAQRITT
jgi:quaternary ammonium compound-resistance protein SugE